jgi:hypothetical protein
MNAKHLTSILTAPSILASGAQDKDGRCREVAITERGVAKLQASTGTRSLRDARQREVSNIETANIVIQGQWP